jgi:hypothetical protein
MEVTANGVQDSRLKQHESPLSTFALHHERRDVRVLPHIIAIQKTQLGDPEASPQEDSQHRMFAVGDARSLEQPLDLPVRGDLCRRNHGNARDPQHTTQAFPV